MSDTTSRIILQEARDQPNVTRRLTSAGMDAPTLVDQVAVLNARLRSLFGYETDPIQVSPSGTWRIDGVAGMLRLNPKVQIEVVPKFLDPDSSGWRADFFLMAVLVRTGHLLVGDEIQAGVADRGDLATLIARTLLRMHWEQQRRPIRGYRRVVRHDFSMDGEVELDTLVLPEPDGFRLQRLELTGQNAYNAVLSKAVQTLIPEVSEGDTRAQLHRLLHQIGPQQQPPRVMRPLPSRHRAWQPAYSLSQLILEGAGLDLDGGDFAGPGFALSTWNAWQSLCEIVLRRAVPKRRVLPQHAFHLGTRPTAEVMVRPDVSVLRGIDTAELLFDAKYKTRRRRQPAIAAADLYESLAFLRAASCRKMLLLYPALADSEDLPLGQWRQFDRVRVRDPAGHEHVIDGLELQVSGLAAKGGFNQLVLGVRDLVSPLLKQGNGDAR